MGKGTSLAAGALAAALGCAADFGLFAGQHAAAQGRAQETRTVQAVRETVFNGIARANELAEEGNFAAAHDETRRLERIGSLNGYERGYIAQMQAFLYALEERHDEAIGAYEEIVRRHEEVPRGMLESALWGLVQLTLVEERYEQTLQYGERWLALAENPGGDPFYRLAYAHFQLGQFEASAGRSRQALAASTAEPDSGEREGYYVLLRAAYVELDDRAALRDVLETMVLRWPKKEYWIHLASVYGEQGLDARQLAILELLHEQGGLDRESEWLALATLYLAAGGAYKGAQLLEQGLAEGMIEASYENYRRLSQAWVQAQDDRRALAPLREAARLAPDGDLYLELAQSHFNLHAFEECADAVRAGLARGGLTREDRAHLVLGHCLLELQSYDQALEQFRLAARDERSRSGAEALIAWIERETEYREQIERDLAEFGVP